MDNPALMAVLHSVTELSEPDRSLSLGDTLEFSHGVEKVPARRLFHYDVHTRVRLDRLSVCIQSRPLTLSSPVMSNGYTSKCSLDHTDGLTHVFIFLHSGTLALKTERQSARIRVPGCQLKTVG